MNFNPPVKSVLTSLVFASSVASAATQLNGTIEKINPYGGKIYIKLKAPFTIVQPFTPCNTNSGWNFFINNDMSPTNSVNFALITTALTKGLRVEMTGSGSCDSLAVEGLSFLILFGA